MNYSRGTRSLNKGLGIREMSNGTSESAGEKAIGLDQDKRKTVRREGQTNEPQSKSGVDQPHPPPPLQGASTTHESNPSALAARLDKYA